MSVPGTVEANGETDLMAHTALSPPGRATMTVVKVLAPAEARIERLVERLVRIINEAYAVGEAGLWLDGATRTDTAEVGGDPQA